MTREEAIDIFEHNWTRLVNSDYTEEELNKAFGIALKALKQEPFFWEKCPYYEPDMIFDGKDEYDMGQCKYKQEPIDDVLDKIQIEIKDTIQWYREHGEEIYSQVLTSAIEIIDKYRKNGDDYEIVVPKGIWNTKYMTESEVRNDRKDNDN